MPDQYFTADPQSAHNPARISFSFRGNPLAFLTDSGVFSRMEVDKGTALLLNTLPETVTGVVLDMGCGYGAIGVSVGKAWPDCRVTMADINARAVALAGQNVKLNDVKATVLQSDGYAALPAEPTFDLILQNPPIRAGKSVIYAMFADGAKRLADGGALWLVIRKQQGAASAVAYLNTLFGAVQVVEKKGGYWVLRCACPKGVASYQFPVSRNADG